MYNLHGIIIQTHVIPRLLDIAYFTFSLVRESLNHKDDYTCTAAHAQINERCHSFSFA